MFNKRNAIILGLLLALVGIEILVIAPKDASPPPEPKLVGPPKPGEVGAGQIMRDVHSVEAKAGGKEWELWAKRAMRAADDSDLTIEDVRVKFFAKNGMYFTVTGKKGRVTPNKDEIRIAGDVVTRSSNGYEFRADSAIYDSKQKMLRSPGAVRMTGPKDPDGGALSLTGREMIVDVASGEMRIDRDVRARKKISHAGGGDRVANIASRRATFSGENNQAKFIDDVVIDVGTLRITGPEARFHYKPGTDFVESMEVKGGARVTDVDKIATSDQVSVQFDSEKIVFSGAPKLMQNGDELAGEEIVFLEGGKKVQVNNARAKIDDQRANDRSWK